MRCRTPQRECSGCPHTYTTPTRTVLHQHVSKKRLCADLRKISTTIRAWRPHLVSHCRRHGEHTTLTLLRKRHHGYRQAAWWTRRVLDFFTLLHCDNELTNRRRRCTTETFSNADHRWWRCMAFYHDTRDTGALEIRVFISGKVTGEFGIWPHFSSEPLLYYSLILQLLKGFFSAGHNARNCPKINLQFGNCSGTMPADWYSEYGHTLQPHPQPHLKTAGFAPTCSASVKNSFYRTILCNDKLDVQQP